MSVTVDLEPAKNIIDQIELSEKLNNGKVHAAYLIPLLQDIQQEYGYLPRTVLEYISKKGGIPLSRIFGVITFYEQFYLEAQGKHTIKCCRGTACHVNNGPKIAEAISDILEVKEGDTTTDGFFTFETVACLGTCFLAPVMMIDDEYFGNLTSGEIKKIIKKFRDGK
ncbi:MAG: NAD(P)H-dependent oxidoreductase subunit E [Spirochaetaceae bacterium]|jgi:NADH-quinone oxidoreductase subunit E|nr:NAD(P)H-dependent oxidoreductase subunit E [Spirochaetaceae bacterium]